MSAATRLNDVAEALAATITAAAIVLDGSPLKVYGCEPRDLDSLPAIAIGNPRFLRTAPDERESQLGSFDWDLTYPVTVAVALDDPQRGQRDARAVAGQIIAAVDHDPTLGGAVEIEAKVVSGEPAFTEPDVQRQMALYKLDVAVWVLET